MGKHEQNESSADSYREVIRKLMMENAQLKVDLHNSHYITVDQFVDEYSEALREYIKSQVVYKNDSEALHHPSDLATSAINFAEAVWYLHDQMDILKRGTNIGKP